MNIWSGYLILTFVVIVIMTIYILGLNSSGYYYKEFRKMCMVHNTTPVMRTRNLPFKEELKDKVEVICAKYNRDTSFLDLLPYKINVLTKNVNVPNIGQEASTYLYHIINNYDNLSEINIFIHDEDESWHHDGKLTEILPPLVNEFYEMKMNYLEFNSLLYRDSHPIPKIYFGMIKDTGLWENIFQKHLGFGKITEYTGVSYQRTSAQFIVSKEYIQRRPKEFYQDLYDWILNFKDDTIDAISKRYGGPGWAQGLFCEFLWYPMFNGKTEIYVDSDKQLPNDLSKLPEDLSKIGDYDVVVELNGVILHKDVRELVIRLLESNDHYMERSGMKLTKGYYYRYKHK